MIYYLKGRLVEKNMDYVVLEVGGIGYQVFIPESLFPELPAMQEELLLFTYLYVREDELTLYGFDRSDARHLFTLVLGVAGIGPKVALKIIGTLPIFDFVQAVLTENYAYLTQVPGIGQKTARRLVLELKEKVSSLTVAMVEDELAKINEGIMQEASTALLALGYSAREAGIALKEVVAQGDDLETLVKKALRYLGEA
ncbi:MAG: Holliday junction branch migration protein RuvA [bacterium]|jgi:Holliday junction DNA helicase RuvA